MSNHGGSSPDSETEDENQKDNADQTADEDETASARAENNLASTSILRRYPEWFSRRLLVIHHP